MKDLLQRLDPRYTKICLYAAVSVLLTLVAAMVLYFSSGFFANLWLLICAVLEPAIYGALLSYLLNPVVERVSHALKRAGWRPADFRMRRILGIVVCLAVLALLLSGIMLLMMLVITRSIQEVNWTTFQRLWDNAQGDISRLVDMLQQRAQSIGLMGDAGDGASAGTSLAGMVSGAFRGVADMLSTMLFSLIFSIYFLIDGNRVSAYLLRILKAIAGENGIGQLMGLLEDADKVFSGYIRGQFTDALVVGLLSAVVLTLVGVPYGPVIGLLTGLGNLIPYVGAPLGIASTVLMCFADGQPQKIVTGVVCLALIMFVDSNVINPKLLSDNVEVHPLLVVAALIAGGAVGGLAGMLVAVPAAAFLKIQLDRWLDAREQRQSDAERIKKERA